MNVLFIGAGAIGRALGHVIQTKAQVDYWDANPSAAPEARPLEETVPQSDFVFLCVPSWAVRSASERIAPLLGRETVVVCLAKGIEKETYKTMDQVMSEVLPTGQPLAVLGGPLLAKELLAGVHGVGVFACEQAAWCERAFALFEGTVMRIECDNAPTSVAWAAVLKNIYAVGLGIAEGLGWGWNAKGWLAGCSLEEMERVIAVLGGDARVVAHSAGAGDFLATAMSPDSRNRTAGHEIALTGSCQTPSEGCRSLPLLLTHLGNHAESFPILHAIDSILTQGVSAQVAFDELFASRDAK